MLVNEWLDTKLGQDIWNNKYRFENESFDEWLDRVSNKNEEVRKLILEKKFLFGGRTLTNYNTYKEGASTSNCYSSGYAPDSLEGIFDLNKNIALTYKAQGGQGISLSKIRPKGSKLSGGYETDGIVPFMRIFNMTTAGVSQGGTRKGALMLSLCVWHKEAETFITIKSQKGEIEKANLSLEIDDEFMQCVKIYYVTGEKVKVNRVFEYETGSIEYEVIPIDIYKKMCEVAWDWAEPGVIYINRFRNYNLMEYVDDYNIITGNPCGEQPLPKNGACNLGSINLSEFVEKPYTEYAYFNLVEFEKAVRIATRALDEVIDYGYKYHALKEQQEMAYNYRNIGLGVMGVGSMFFKMGLVYGEDSTLKLIDEIMTSMFRNSVFASNELAKEKGTFPKYDNRVFQSTIIKNHFSVEEIEKLKEDGLRNCSLLSVAPSGSIGTMLNITTGCEPAFRISYKRKTESLHKDKEVYYDVYIKEAEEYKLINDVDSLPIYFISSESIDFKSRVMMQSVIQNHIDTAISSTINLPKETTVEEVEELYLYAWEKGLKGVTIYRDGCKKDGILTIEGSKVGEKENLARGVWKPKAKDTFYHQRKVKIGCGKVNLMIGWSDTEKEIQDMYVIRSGNGGCERNLQGVVIGISGMLRYGGNILSIEKAFEGVGGCNSFVTQRAKGEKLSSGNNCGNAIIREIKQFLKEQSGEIKSVEVKVKKEVEKQVLVNADRCPVCGEKIQHSGGCISCVGCGYSKCS